MKRVCIVVSTPLTIKAFMLNHIKLLEKEYEVYLISSEDMDYKKEYGISCKSIKVNIERKIKPFEDIKSFFNLYRLFKKESFDLVLSITPKAGLLSMLAAKFAKIKRRVHFFTGQVWATKSGVKRELFKTIDKLLANSCTNILVDSPSQIAFLEIQRVIKVNSAKSLNRGSISGVDTQKFRFKGKKREELREKYSILDSDTVFMFIGRLNRDKGVLDIDEAFFKLLKKRDDFKLFIVGPDEEMMEERIKTLLNHERVFRIGYVNDPENILNLCDILILPSYREGFGTIILEAASMGIMSIGSDIYGLVDAIEDKKSGLLHKKGDVEDMIEKYSYILENKELIKEYGDYAKFRVYRDFDSEVISKEFKEYIDSLMEER